MMTGEALRPQYDTPRDLLHLVPTTPVKENVEDWYTVVDSEGKQIFEGTFGACFRLRKNLENAERVPKFGMKICLKNYSSQNYTKGVNYDS